MQNKPYAKFWKIFSWIELVENSLVGMSFGLMTALFLIGRDKPTARDWLYFILGGIVIYQFRALVRYIVRCPRCHHRFFHMRYWLEHPHKCRHCELVIRAESDEASQADLSASTILQSND
jgi:hypothetical protein